MNLIGFKSNKGIKRTNNEDACFIMPKEQVYMVADGVGGNNSGELASRTAVTSVADYIKANPLDLVRQEDHLKEYFEKCIAKANEDILLLGEKHEKNKGMATTLIVCHIRGTKGYILNVGDSRAYVFRGEELFQITEDHSYVNSLVKLGVITQKEAQGHQKSHVITRALGAEETIAADFYQTNLRDGDILLLCTDGLYGEVGSDKISQIMYAETQMTSLAEKLISEANRAGGNDNITVICIKIRGGKADE
jgi:PPM family protein phosphatase